MTQVFISYSRADLIFVEQIAGDLRDAGFDVWYDLSGLDGGTRWSTEITKAIRNSQFVIVVLSPDSVISEWVEREYLLAGSLKRPVVPLYYRACELPLGYLNLHYIDVQGMNYKHHFNQILRALDEKAASSRAYKRSPVVPSIPHAEYPRKNNPFLAGSIAGVLVIGIAVLSYLVGSGKLSFGPPEIETTMAIPNTGVVESPTAAVTDVPKTDLPKPVDTVSPNPKVKKENLTNFLASGLFEKDLRNMVTSKEEEYSDAEYVTRSEFTYTISLDRSEDVVWQWRWCAKDQAILIRNFEYIIVNFTINGEDIPQSELVEDQYTKDDGSECRIYYVTLYDWPEGTYHLVNIVTFTQPINDGWDDYQPQTRKYDYLVYVKP